MRVDVIHEVGKAYGGGWTLYLQWCRYRYDQKDIDTHGYSQSETGYRFIWRCPNIGHLQAARGQARIPSLKFTTELMHMAQATG